MTNRANRGNINWQDHIELVEDSSNPTYRARRNPPNSKSTLPEDNTPSTEDSLLAPFFGSKFKIFNTVLLLSTLSLSLKYNHLSLWCIIAGIYSIFVNLGKREKGTLSAYSIFNKNFERPLGQYEDPYRNARQGGGKTTRSRRSEMSEEDLEEKKLIYFAKRAKYGNKSCYCGSGRKYKKCCYQFDLKEYYGQLDKDRQDLKASL